MPTRLPSPSPDLTADPLAQLQALFPEAFTEGRLDLDRLRTLLGEAASDEPERYRLEWAGKAQATRVAQTPGVGTLRPDRDNAVAFDTAPHTVIEGDNLEVLKL